MERTVVDGVVEGVGDVDGGDSDCGVIEEDVAFGLHDDAVGLRGSDDVSEVEHFESVEGVVNGEGLEILVVEGSPVYDLGEDHVHIHLGVGGRREVHVNGQLDAIGRTEKALTSGVVREVGRVGAGASADFLKQEEPQVAVLTGHGVVRAGEASSVARHALVEGDVVSLLEELVGAVLQTSALV